MSFAFTASGRDRTHGVESSQPCPAMELPVELGASGGWLPDRCRLRAWAGSSLATAALLGLCSVGAAGQDTPAVTGPAIPTVCVILKAAMSALHGIAPQDEMWVDTPRIQAAIDHCHQGQAVELSDDGEANAFLSGTLRMHKGVTLLIDKDVTLYGSRNPRDYDVQLGSCGIVDESNKKGCQALIEADHASHSGVMGEGTIDGRGGAKLIVNGVEQPQSWWFLDEEARVWGHPQLPRLIDANHSNDFKVYGVTLRNSPSVHVGFQKGDGLTVRGIKIDTPYTARNTDGIDASSAKNVTVTESYTRLGNGYVAIKADGSPSRDLTISDAGAVLNANARPPHSVEKAKLDRNQEIITLSRPVSAASAADPAVPAPALVTAPSKPAVTRVVQRRAPVCVPGHCGITVRTHRVAHVPRSTLRCRRAHTCGALAAHRRVGDRRGARRRHHRMLRKVPITVAQPVPSQQAVGLQAMSNSR